MSGVRYAHGWQCVHNKGTIGSALGNRADKNRSLRSGGAARLHRGGTRANM